jgi:hypothetical protein
VFLEALFRLLQFPDSLLRGISELPQTPYPGALFCKNLVDNSYLDIKGSFIA